MRFIAAALLAVSLAGCGAAHATPKRDVAAERAVRAAIHSYESALLAGDAKRLCAGTALASRLALRRLYGGDCLTIMEQFEPQRTTRAEIARIDVQGHRATATIEGMPLRLVREPTGWKLLFDLAAFDAENSKARHD